MLRVFQNRVLRRIFGQSRDQVTGGWRKLHNEELRDLYSSPSIIRIIKSLRMKWAGHVARMGEKGNAHNLLMGKPDGKRPLGQPKVGGWIILRWISSFLTRWYSTLNKHPQNIRLHVVALCPIKEEATSVRFTAFRLGSAQAQ
jgi:hypothetical protein